MTTRTRVLRYARIFLHPCIPDNLYIRHFPDYLFSYIIIPFTEHFCNYRTRSKCRQDDRVPVTIYNSQHRNTSMSADMPTHRSRVITDRKHPTTVFRHPRIDLMSTVIDHKNTPGARRLPVQVR